MSPGTAPGARTAARCSSGRSPPAAQRLSYVPASVSSTMSAPGLARPSRVASQALQRAALPHMAARSEEHTSELQSQSNLVCRLLLEKKKKKLDILVTA